VPVRRGAGRCPWIAPGIDGDRQDGKRYPLPNPRL